MSRSPEARVHCLVLKLPPRLAHRTANVPSAPRPFSPGFVCGTFTTSPRPTPASTAHTPRTFRRISTHTHTPGSTAHGRRSPSPVASTSPPTDTPGRKRIVGFRCTDGLCGMYNLDNAIRYPAIRDVWNRLRLVRKVLKQEEDASHAIWRHDAALRKL